MIASVIGSNSLQRRGRVLKPIMALLLAVIFALSVPARSWGAEIDDLQKRIDTLEKNQSELYHSLDEKKKPGLGKEIAENITLGGLIEIEAGYENTDAMAGGDVEASDITLATVELSIDAEVNRKVKGHILLLWEEGDSDPINMDEGTIEISLGENSKLTVGKMYLPFGNFESHFISDPLTLELAETNDTALALSFEAGPAEVTIAFSNGGVEEAGDDNINDYAVGVTMEPIEGLTLGASYISDIADTDGELTGLSTMVDTVAGYSAFLSLSLGPVSIEGEVVSALDEFDLADYDNLGDGKEDEPSAFNVELAATIGYNFEIGIKYEESDDIDGLPTKQCGIVYSLGLYENVTFGVEYLRGEFDNEDERDLVTAQLALEF